MNKLALSLPLIAAAALAGCATEEYRPGTPVATASGAPVASGSGVPVVSSAPSPGRGAAIRPGTGTVESVTAVPFLGSASVGAAAPGTASRLAIRMGDGTVQYLDYTDRDLTVGTRVEITSDGFIRKL